MSTLPAKKEDVYQSYYLEHQRRKKRLLNSVPIQLGRSFQEILIERRSQRIFTSKSVDPKTLAFLLESAVYAPSSCNRQAVWVSLYDDPKDISHLEQILVGGKGWLDAAPHVILLYADMLAYKSPVEKDFMPWLDIGVMVQTLLLTAEDMHLGACYVNPNIRTEFTEFFTEHFRPREFLLFGGAIAIGHYDLKAETPPKRASAYLGKEDDNRC